MGQITPFVGIIIEKGALDLIAYIPRDEVVCFRSWGEPAAIEDMFAQFPNIRTLHSVSILLPAIFPEPNLDGNERIPTSLQHIHLDLPVVDGGDWSPLTTFLARRASSENRLDSLTLDRSPRMSLTVEERIRSMVQEFRIT